MYKILINLRKILEFKIKFNIIFFFFFLKLYDKINATNLKPQRFNYDLFLKSNEVS